MSSNKLRNYELGLLDAHLSSIFPLARTSLFFFLPYSDSCPQVLFTLAFPSYSLVSSILLRPLFKFAAHCSNNLGKLIIVSLFTLDQLLVLRTTLDSGPFTVLMLLLSVPGYLALGQDSHLLFTTPCAAAPVLVYDLKVKNLLAWQSPAFRIVIWSFPNIM